MTGFHLAAFQGSIGVVGAANIGITWFELSLLYIPSVSEVYTCILLVSNSGEGGAYPRTHRANFYNFIDYYIVNQYIPLITNLSQATFQRCFKHSVQLTDKLETTVKTTQPIMTSVLRINNVIHTSLCVIVRTPATQLEQSVYIIDACIHR